MLDVLFDHGAAWFSVPALLGTGVFLIRVVLMLVGGHHGDFSSDPGVHDVALHAHDKDVPGWISVSTIAGFVMGFGWCGLAALRGSGLGFGVSALIGIAGGLAFFGLTGWLLRLIFGLQSSGNVRLDSAVGLEGDVYAQVPGKDEPTGAFGKVRLVFGDRARLINAVSDGPALSTRTRVRVVRVLSNQSVVVTRADVSP
jgi:hypothetical protein